MDSSKNQWRYLVGMVVAMLLWGVAWTAGKMAAEHSNPQVAAFWRYGVSFITLLPVIWYLKTPLKSDKKGYMYMIGAGLLTSLFNYLFFAGLSHGAAGYGGTMVTALSPIVTYIFSILFFGIKLTSRQLIALGVGILGALILLRVPEEGFGFLNIQSSYFLGCAVVWALVTILSQKAAPRANPMFYTLIVFAIAGFTNMLFALPHHPFAFASYDSMFWMTIIFVGVLPGTFSTALFFLSASKVGAHRTGVFMFIVPVGATLSSWLVYGESIAPSTIIGCLLAFAAVFLFNMKKRDGKSKIK